MRSTHMSTRRGSTSSRSRASLTMHALGASAFARCRCLGLPILPNLQVSHANHPQSPSTCSPQASTLPVLVGEWSLATDSCAMWLNGFHDNAPGFPKVTCGSMPCPPPYVTGIAGPSMGVALWPHGTGSSAPANGHAVAAATSEAPAEAERPAADLAAADLDGVDESLFLGEDFDDADIE